MFTYYFGPTISWLFLLLKYFCPLTMLFLTYQSLVKFPIIKSYSSDTIKEGCHHTAILKGRKCRINIAGALWLTWPKVCFCLEKTSDISGFSRTLVPTAISFPALPSIWKKLMQLQFVKPYDGWMCRSIIFFMVRSKNIFLMLRALCAKKVCAAENDDASTDHKSDQ